MITRIAMLQLARLLGKEESLAKKEESQQGKDNNRASSDF